MFEYHLSDEEILTALENGSVRAQEILDNVKNPEDLQDKFKRAIWGADHLLERFSKDGLSNGDKIYSHSGEKTPSSRLKEMMLKAFQAVQTVRDLEHVIDLSRPNTPPQGIAIKKTALLFTAAAVYESEGKSTTPVNNIVQIVQTYQKDSHTHFHAA